MWRLLYIIIIVYLCERSNVVVSVWGEHWEWVTTSVLIAITQLLVKAPHYYSSCLTLHTLLTNRGWSGVIRERDEIGTNVTLPLKIRHIPQFALTQVLHYISQPKRQLNKEIVTIKLFVEMPDIELRHKPQYTFNCEVL